MARGGCQCGAPSKKKKDQKEPEDLRIKIRLSATSPKLLKLLVINLGHFSLYY